MNYKNLAVIAGVAMTAAVGAYLVGINQGGESDVAPQQASTPAPQAVAPHAAGTMPAPGRGGVGSDRFVQFSIGNRNVKSMASDGDIVWIGTSMGVIRYDTKTDQHVVHNVENGSLLSNGVFHVSKLGEKILVGTYGGGMSVLDKKSGKWSNYNIPQGLADQFVYDVEVMDNGDVWLATWSGANLIRGGNLDDASKWVTYTVKNTNGGLPNDWVYGLEKAKDGGIWIGTEGGLAHFKDGKWVKWAHKEGLGAPIEVVRKDIKLSNDPGMASKHHARQKQEQGLGNVDIPYNPNYIISMAVDRDGVIWCGTWGAGLARYDGRSWKNYTVKDGLPANHVFMLHVDNKGTLWVGTNHGMAKYLGEGKGFSVRGTADGLFSDNVFSMTEGNDGSTWIGSFGGVSRIKDFN